MKYRNLLIGTVENQLAQSGIFALILMFAIISLTGCLPAGTEILHLHADPTLTIKDLERDRIAVLPAMASSLMMDANELSPVAQQLAWNLARGRPTIALAEQARVDNAIRARPELEPVLQQFAHTYAIPREKLHELGVATGARFIVAIVFDQYSFGYDLAPPQYRLNTDNLYSIATEKGGLVGLGIGLFAAAIAPPQSSQPTLLQARRATVRLAGTLSIFNTIERRAVWVGAAMVSESVEQSTAPTAWSEED